MKWVDSYRKEKIRYAQEVEKNKKNKETRMVGREI